MEAFNSIGKTAKLTVVKVSLDVVQAFASIVAALTMPLSGRGEVVQDILTENGFSMADIEEIVKAGD